MKAVFTLGLALCVLGGWPALAQSPDDQYIGIYATIQEADALLAAGRNSEAATRYEQAQSALRRMKTVYPNWNPRVVNFRLNYLASRLAVTGPPPAPQPPDTPPASAPPTPVASPDPALQKEVRELRELVEQLQADKALLQAKLKEAFEIQPAAVDPRELAQANERIVSLEKEKDLLQTTLEQERARLPAANAAERERFRQQLAEANQQLRTQTERVESLTREKRAMQQRLEALAGAPAAAAELEQVRRALAEATQKLSEQTARNEQLAQDRDALQTRLRQWDAEVEAAAALRAENELLKRQLADARAAASREDTEQALKQAQARIVALQSDLEILRLEKTTLENRLSTMATAPPAPPPPSVDAERLRQLERERDELQKQLAAVTRELTGVRDESAGRTREMTDQLTVLRARLEILEATPVPYTAEELALMKPPAPRLAVVDSAPSRPAVPQSPAGSATLIAAAQRQFAIRQYDQAETNLLQVLRADEQNVNVQANLAVIQMQLNKLDEAERQVRQALSHAPNDAFSHFVLGQVKLREEQYGAAVDALSRAAQLNPQEAEIQNFLGIALSHQGLRMPAETALRRAILLEPGYGSAHNNLAVIYLNQNPPMVELARWHYQRALAAGHPRNPELEKALETK